MWTFLHDIYGGGPALEVSTNFTTYPNPNGSRGGGQRTITNEPAAASRTDKDNDENDRDDDDDDVDDENDDSNGALPCGQSN